LRKRQWGGKRVVLVEQHGQNSAAGFQLKVGQRGGRECPRKDKKKKKIEKKKGPIRHPDDPVNGGLSVNF